MSRLKASVYLQNVLGGLDQWLHGENGLRGWGAAAMPDPVLLVPRSFDAATNRFRYDVNARFADTRTARTLTREPFRITIDFSLRLSTDYPLQELRLALEPVKTKEGWQRRTADSITAFYLQGTSNVHKLVLSESDSLFLTKAQTAAFKQADSAFSEQVRATYSALGAYLASMNGKASRAALDSAKGAAKAYWKVFWLQPEIADSLLTASQKELLPMLKSMVQVPKRDREDSQWMFGNPVDFKQGESKPESERKGLPMPIIP
jgi:hypothetical protein